MAHNSPLGKIKDITAASLKVPLSAAGSAVGLARTTTGKATDVVTSLVGGSADPVEAKTSEASQTEPVNVIDELGLDPAPVDKPKPAKKPAKKAVTKIDAAADPSHVDATPADVARAAEKE